MAATMTQTLLATASVVAFIPFFAHADEQSTELGVTQPLPGPKPPEAPGIVGNGGWLFADSPYVAETLQPVVISRFSYSDTTSATRPFSANVGSPGAAVELGGELGLGSGFSLQAVALSGVSYTTNATTAGGTAGIRFSAFPRGWEHWQLVLSSGYLRELSGGNGLWLTLQSGFTSGPVRAQLSVNAQHVFQADRDGADIMVTAGVAVKLVSFFSLGVEYLGQDMESLFIADGDDAEGGARHLLGPTLAFAFLDDKLSIVAGPAVSIGMSNVKLIGRFALSYGF